MVTQRSSNNHQFSVQCVYTEYSKLVPDLIVHSRVTCLLHFIVNEGIYTWRVLLPCCCRTRSVCVDHINMWSNASDADRYGSSQLHSNVIDSRRLLFLGCWYFRARATIQHPGKIDRKLNNVLKSSTFADSCCEISFCHLCGNSHLICYKFINPSFEVFFFYYFAC